jgi:type IV pilus assembly protein PilW
MIELLISLAISSFLILGITQVYIDNKRNNAFQQSQAGNQENSKFLVLLVDGYLNKTGYRRAANLNREEAFPQASATTDCEAFAAGAAITKAKAAGELRSGVCIRYKPLTSQELDCIGNQTPAFNDAKAFNITDKASVTMALYYKQDPVAGNLNGTLECRVANTSAVLLTGLADFRLQFAIDSNNDGSIDNTISTDDWTSSTEILQVRYAALLASNPNQRSSDDSAVLNTWKTDASTPSKTRLASADKHHMYQLATSTVSMRNLTP